MRILPTTTGGKAPQAMILAGFSKSDVASKSMHQGVSLAGNVRCWHVGQSVKTTDIFYVGNMSADMSANMLAKCPKNMSAAGR